MDVNLDELKEVEFSGGSDSGSTLGLKLLLQALDNVILVSSSDLKGLNIPFVHAGTNAVSVARGIARSLDPKVDTTVVVFAGDGSTSEHLNSLINATENILYVCANDQGYSCMDEKLGKSFSKELVAGSAYLATATVSHPDDYIAKLKKAAATPGFKFIDLLCPSPEFWEFEPSNMIEVGRVAVETGLWPLFEIERGTVNLTKRPNRLEPVDIFNHVQKRFAIKEEDIEKVQEKTNRNWKRLTDGKIL